MEKGGLIAGVIQTAIKTVIKITKKTTTLETCSHVCACLGCTYESLEFRVEMLMLLKAFVSIAIPF